ITYSDVPEVRYAKSGDVHIAYQVYGSGPVSIVMAPGAITHLEYYWKEPGMRRWLEGLGRFAKSAIFDKRGTGMADRGAGIPTYEERMDDIRTVMAPAGFETTTLLAVSGGVPICILF